MVSMFDFLIFFFLDFTKAKFFKNIIVAENNGTPEVQIFCDCLKLYFGERGDLVQIGPYLEFEQSF